MKKGLHIQDVTSLLITFGMTEKEIQSTIDLLFKHSKDKILSLSNVSKSFQKHAVLSNISLDIHQGEIFGLIGPSGTGKTTLLNLLVGYYPPTKGDIVVHGKNQISVVNHKALVRKLFGFSTQNPSVYQKLSVW